jgi:cell division protein FtsW
MRRSCKRNKRTDDSRPAVSRVAKASVPRAGGLGRRLRGWFSRGPRAPAAAQQQGLDLLLLVPILMLVGLGLVVVYSASAVHAADRYGSHFFFLERDAIYVSLGLFALYVGWRVDYRVYRRFAYPLLGLALALLGLVLLLGTRVDGAIRWFRVAGVSLQPSEPAKLALVVYLAYSLAKKRERVRSFSVGFLPHLCVAGLMCLLVLRQPDLGTAAVLGAVAVLVLFVAGTKLSYILLALLASAPVAYHLIVGTPWRLRRLLAFLDPWAHRRDAGYQISESLISIGSGGLHGLGLGDGKQKLFFLPAAHTDFIFAIIGEELGLVGMAGVVLLFLIITLRGIRAAVGSRDLFGTYLAYGITATLGLQALLHMCVVMGLMPTKGITLPLVSYGGSALITSLYSMGILLNVAARNPEPARLREARAPAPYNRRKSQRVVVRNAG